MGNLELIGLGDLKAFMNTNLCNLKQVGSGLTLGHEKPEMSVWVKEVQVGTYSQASYLQLCKPLGQAVLPLLIYAKAHGTGPSVQKPSFSFWLFC